MRHKDINFTYITRHKGTIQLASSLETNFVPLVPF